MKMSTNPPFSKIICLGDSITCNWNAPSYVDYWQELLDEKYGKSEVQVSAKGINGETAQDGYYRVDRDVVAENPDLVTIMFGHNDADPSREISPVLFVNYIRKIVNYLQHETKAEIWVLSPQQIGTLDSKIHERYQPYLELLQQSAKDKKVRYVDLWQVFQNEDMDEIYTGTFNSTYIRGAGKDWLHPNEKGHRIIAERLMNTLFSR